MRALICGVTGQDGTYLARLLVDKGYEVWGTSRDAQMASLANLESVGVSQSVRMLSMAPNDFRSVLNALEASDPDEVYLLAGQSSVGLSFEQPVETLESIAQGTLNVLEAVRFRGRKLRLYHASSSECFGDVGRCAANERTPFHPSSPYAVAKSSAHWLVSNYRVAYGLYACNGILFNHESPLRPTRFVTRKIVAAAARIAAGATEKLVLGRLDVVRDWGWAPEYVEAMWSMLQAPQAQDFVIATGMASSLEQFVQAAFEEFDLDWREHTTNSPALHRPSDLAWSQGDPSRARTELGWSSRSNMYDVVAKLCDAEKRAQ